MTDKIQTMWAIGQYPYPDEWTHVADICRTAIDWGHARQAVLAETTPDVRQNPAFGERLDALATAEAALFAAVKARKESA